MKLAQRLLVEHIRNLAEQGKTRQQIADATELEYAYICRILNSNSIPVTRQLKAGNPEARLRAIDMRRRYENGETLIQIGTRYSLTRERVRQILQKYFGMCGRDGGKAEQGRRKRRANHDKRDARAQKAWGCSYAEYRRILKLPGRPTYGYISQRRNARERGIGWEITLWQWWKVWEKSGHWAERGRGRGYGMCRLNDTGPYAVDNVYIATGVENMQDYWAKKRAAPILEAAQ